MKTHALLTTLLWLIIFTSSGKILNGYEKNITTARSSFQHLRKLMHHKDVIKRLSAIEEYILYHELTNALLIQFRIVSPSIYMQIDTIVDINGRNVDVYVKFVPSNKTIEGTIASTNINQMANDEHAYVSEYGPRTISIQISATKHSLRILAHEFGHIAYQVPNLAAYVDFFSRNYPDRHLKASYLGHKPNDPSGQEAQHFERQFLDDLALHYKKAKLKLEHPMIIRDRIEKRLWK